MNGGIAREDCKASLLEPRPSKFFHHTFPPLADPFKRRFGPVVAHFRMVHRNIQFRITDALDVTFANFYVFYVVRW